MEIIRLTQRSLFVRQYQYLNTNFAIKIEKLKQIWLFNCHEGCQHLLARKKLKISQITKIIITELSIRNVSGLLGLLSSLSLSTKMSKLDIYGPPGLINYLIRGRRYSQTSFHYVISIYNIQTGLVVANDFCRLYAFSSTLYASCFQYIILTSEKAGKFNLCKAISYQISAGPLYNKLKLGATFVLPDGTVISGTNFVYRYYLGYKIVFISNHGKRQFCEVESNSQVIICK
uniref:Uncharacterized protein n=1 Tax=Rhodogorgon sp. TaxID=2485824 RepID=A0A3G3MI96_9FLOR|nr:hypothetical protein [Rhodogorgon sp.]